MYPPKLYYLNIIINNSLSNINIYKTGTIKEKNNIKTLKKLRRNDENSNILEKYNSIWIRKRSHNCKLNV